MLVVSPDGGFVAASTDEGLGIARLDDDGESVDVALAGRAVALHALDDEVWVVEERAGGMVVRRFAATGEERGAGLALDAAGDAAILASADGGASLIVDDGQAAWLVSADGRELGAVHLPTRDRVVALLQRGAIVTQGAGALHLARPGGLLAFALPSGTRRAARVTGASLLFGGVAVGFHLALADGKDGALLVYDARRGELMRRMRVAGELAVRFVAERNQVLLVGREELAVIDARNGLRLATFGAPFAVEDAAVDRAGTLLVLRGAGRELAVLDYDDLFGGTVEEEQVEPEPIAEPEASEREASEPVPVPVPVPVPDVQPIDDDDDAAADGDLDALESRPLLGLHPRDPDADAGPHARDVFARSLEAALLFVTTCCRRAIAEAWDSGRLSHSAATALPFEGEVQALLDDTRGRAADDRARATARAAEIALGFRAALTLGGAGPLAALAQLADDLGLDALALDVLLVVAAPRLRGELARSYGILANDPSRPLCDELLVAQLLAADPPARAAIARALEPDAPLVRSGAVIVGAGERPWAALTASTAIVDLLRAGPLPTPRSAPRLADLRLPATLLADVVDAAARARDPERPLRLVLRGRRGTGRRTLFRALAAAAGRPVAELELGAVSTDGVAAVERLRHALHAAALRGAIPCLSGLDAAAQAGPAVESELERLLARHPGPLFARATPDGRLPLAAGHVAFALPLPSEQERDAAWRAALSRRGYTVDDDSSARLAAKWRVGVGTIERLALSIDERGQGRGARPGGLERAIDATMRHERAAALETVATRIDRLPSLAQVVLPEDLRDSLHEFLGRVQLRRTVYDQWGYDRVVTSARGLTALFQGGPGTGKSMVAGAIARELGYELYRIDLGRVLSKWIGETEKNLGAIFDAAEEGEVVLLFDEADALFTRRTEVKSSVDKYANAEVNYLLQRLDSFEGVAVLTTNFGASIDAAFKRRLTLRLTFPFPDEAAREQLWEVHLPPELPRAGALDVAELARRYQLSGGYIRNAALRAAFLAAREGGALEQEHLVRAIRLEYRDNGKLTEDGVLE